MKKAELVKIWKQLDKALGAIDILAENGIENEYIDTSAIVSLKNQVEVMIEAKTKTAHVELK